MQIAKNSKKHNWNFQIRIGEFFGGPENISRGGPPPHPPLEMFFRPPKNLGFELKSFNYVFCYFLQFAFPPILISQSSCRSRHGICSVKILTHTKLNYMKSKHHYNTSLKCILSKCFSLILPRTATSGYTVLLVVPFTKPNVFVIRCQILCFVKNLPLTLTTSCKMKRDKSSTTFKSCFSWR